jgi:hypothetical protein
VQREEVGVEPGVETAPPWVICHVDDGTEGQEEGEGADDKQDAHPVALRQPPIGDIGLPSLPSFPELPGQGDEENGGARGGEGALPETQAGSRRGRQDDEGQARQHGGCQEAFGSTA